MGRDGHAGQWLKHGKDPCIPGHYPTGRNDRSTDRSFLKSMLGQHCLEAVGRRLLTQFRIGPGRLRIVVSFCIPVLNPTEAMSN